MTHSVAGNVRGRGAFKAAPMALHIFLRAGFTGRGTVLYDRHVSRPLQGGFAVRAEVFRALGIAFATSEACRGSAREDASRCWRFW